MGLVRDGTKVIIHAMLHGKNSGSIGFEKQEVSYGESEICEECHERLTNKRFLGHTVCNLCIDPIFLKKVLNEQALVQSTSDVSVPPEDKISSS